MDRRDRFSSRRRERGIALVYVAVSMFALLGLAALAIDLVTLYVAKSQAQRAADAGALAGAKTLIERGITADPQDTRTSWATTCDKATAQARYIANRARIGGVAPATVTPCYGSGGACVPLVCPAASAGTGFSANPQVSVTVQSTALPLFFAKIWGQGTATVSATGTAEGFNPSGTDIPVAAKCVSPWLLPNIDPYNNTVIFNKGTGLLLNNKPSITTDQQGIIGRPIQLVTGCPGAMACGGGVNPPPLTAPPGPPPQLTYYPVNLPNPAASGPSCSVAGTYHENITSCNPTPLACGQTVSVDLTALPADAVNNEAALECRTGAMGTGLGKGQDTLDVTGFPFEIDAGNTHNGVVATTQVTTSRSVVTIPVYDSGPTAGVYGAPTNTVTVIGFVQAFVNSSAGGDPTITILNVSACKTSALTSTVAPVGLNEASPVPVRLIHP